MHHSTNRETGTLRWHLWADRPESPACWLLGHKPRIEIVEPAHRGSIRPCLDEHVWIKVDCSRCLWRFHQDVPQVQYGDDSHDAYLRVEAARRELHSARLAVARRDPANYLRSIGRRDGDGGHWDRPQVQVGVEAYWHPAMARRTGHRRPWHDGWGFRLHLGTEHSESPLHANLYLHWVSLYLSTSLGGRLARAIGGGHKRDLSLETHHGSLWWKAWFDDDGGSDDHHRCDKWRRPRLWPWSAGRDKHRSWMCLRHGNVDLDPRTALWGDPRPTREVLAEATIMVVVGQFPGDAYPVEVRLERETWAREHGPRAGAPVDVTIGWEWDASAVGGIPVRNHSWKGDSTLSSYQRLAEEPPAGTHWTTHLASLVVVQVVRDREHHGYVPPRHLSAL